MCGRYQIATEDKDIDEIVRILEEIQGKYGDVVKTGDIRPTNIAPVLAGRGREVLAFPMRWGFVGWASYSKKDMDKPIELRKKNKPPTVFNARVETADQKSLFKESLFQRRMVIPTTGFYEWATLEGSSEKEMFLFSSQADKVLYLAGIYKQYEAEEFARFTMLTTGANDVMEKYHNRMPVLLAKDEIEQWLFGEGWKEILVREPFEIEAKKV